MPETLPLATVKAHLSELVNRFSGQLEELWSARRGPYWVVYEIDHATRTIVVAVGRRADVYRRR